MKPCAQEHPDIVEGCPTCYLAANVRSYQRHWQLPETGSLERLSRSPRERVFPINGAGRCPYEGPVIEPCNEKCESKAEARHVRLCLHPDPADPDRDKCTRGMVSDKVQSCATCDDRPDRKKRTPLEWISTAQLAADAVKLAGQLPPTVSGIVGIPRSGMVPASIVSVLLHLPLWRLEHDGGLMAVGHGGRGRKDALAGKGGSLLAVIDDTVYNGAALRRARQQMRGIASIFGAVYVKPESRDVADFWHRLLPSPHLLEWNALNPGPLPAVPNPVYGRGFALDLDGVICHDAESGGKVGTPYLIPRAHHCPLIATGRPARARAATVDWLALHGIRFDRLEMLPDDDPATVQTIAAHKARHYKASGCGFFIESDPDQAELIHEATGKPVICPLVGRIWQKSLPKVRDIIRPKGAGDRSASR